MTADERDLFGDEQSYIAWKRQQEAEARADALKSARARQKKRRVKYSHRIFLAFNRIRNQRWRAAICADPLRYAAYQKRNADKARAWYWRHPELARERARRDYQANKDQRILAHQAWLSDHPEYYRAYTRAYYQEHRREIIDKQKVYAVAHRDEINAKRRLRYANKTQEAKEAHHAKCNAYREANHEKVKAKKRAYYAAKKAAQQQEQG